MKNEREKRSAGGEPAFDVFKFYSAFCFVGNWICARMTAGNITHAADVFPDAHLLVRMIAPAMTANTLSRLSRMVTTVGLESFCARICSV